ncbi:bis(5'-nucleosyl)-tetraphosphatase [soil metagenome]
MPRIEHSAGFIVFVDPDESHPEREYLVLHTGRFWDFAKGHPENGEDDLAAAKRELAEEAGVNEVEVIPGFAHEIEYFFRQKKAGLIHKTVVFFLGRAKSRDVKISHEHVAGEFLPAAAAIDRVTYATAKQVLREAIVFLESREK